VITSDFYKAYEGLVKTVAYNYENDPQKFDDLVQDIWLQICRKADMLPKDDAAYTTWIQVLAENVCKHHIKSEKHNPDLVFDSSLTPVIDGEVSEGSWIEQMVPSQSTAEDEQLLSELMFRAASLSEQEAAVFNLVYWHGKSYAATAEKLGISVDTIGPLVGRIREKLEVKELYHKAYTYHGGGNAYADWSFKPKGPGNERMGGIDGTESGLPLGGNGSTQWVSRPDLVEKYNNGITTSNWFDSAGFEQTL
jgi:RNA polymerase sigma factor (sigma-70 family)